MSKPLVQSTGRRKRAVARVRVRTGSGQVVVNGRAMDDYFPSRTHRMQVLEPLKLTETAEVYDVDITLHGGGPTGQAGALRHGLARALVAANEENRVAMRKAGLLTRDSRMVERKKYGQPGARKRFQFSKR